MKRRSVFFVVMVFFMFLFTSSVSLAAEISSIMYNDGSDKEITDFRKTYFSNKNIIDITVEYVCEDEDPEVTSVKIGSLEEEPDYLDEVTFEDFELKDGVNSLTVELIDEAGKSVKQNIKIDYSGSYLVSGAEYKGEIPSDGKLSVLEDGVNLTFAKGNYVVDADGETIDNNTVLFKVYRSENIDVYSQPISNCIGIYSDDDDGDNFAYPGTITLKYMEDSIELSPSLITILFKAKGTDEWKNISALVDSKKKTATTSFQGFGEYGVYLKSKYFDDFNWSRPFAEALWAKGIMRTETVEDGKAKLGLAENCTRAEFASMIVKGLGLTPVDVDETEERFSDLPADDETKQDILTAAAYGIMEGNSDGTFDPDESLTRQQAAAVVARVLNLSLTIDREKVNAALGKIFKDSADFAAISEWARPYVLACVKAKIIVGDTEGKFNAGSSLKRDAAAKLVYYIMEEKDRI